jgi:integral membrane protein
MNNAQEAVSHVKNPEFLRRLRTLSLIEGWSTLILFFIAMPVKYLMDIPEAVSWPGRIHGGLFVMLVIAALIGIKAIPMSGRLSFLLIVAAIFPFGPFLMDRKLKALA